MRAVIEKDALAEGFAGNLSEVFVLSQSAVLGVTPEIIKQYMEVGDGVGMFKEWFSRVFLTETKYFLVSPRALQNYKLSKDCLLSNYLGAAFHHSGPLITSPGLDFTPLKPDLWGVDVIEAGNYKHDPLSNHAGVKVAAIISLAPTGCQSPQLLAKYFARENKVFIFDKNINLAGADLICEFTKYADAACKFVVVSNFKGAGQRGLLDRVQLEKYLNSNKHGGTVEVLQADAKTLRSYHDRFVFLGDRFQLSFSSGLDCFGRPPSWNNSDGDVVVHCVHNSTSTMEFDAGARKSYRFKSKG